MEKRHICPVQVPMPTPLGGEKRESWFMSKQDGAEVRRGTGEKPVPPGRIAWVSRIGGKWELDAARPEALRANPHFPYACCEWHAASPLETLTL